MGWDIRDKVVLVTGGSSGIGLATAFELAKCGAVVTITSRSAERAKAAADSIKVATGVNIGSLELDLSELNSVDSFVEYYFNTNKQLDILINNAGTISGKRRLTNDGFELTFASNYLGSFYLTKRLLPLISENSGNRIINLSSELYRNVKGGLDLNNLQLSHGYSPSKAYANSKLAVMLFTFELVRRYANIESFAIHPGVIRTNFGTRPDSGLGMSLMMRLLGPVLKKPAHGARSSVLLATSPKEEIGASWYWSEGRPVEPLPIARDTEKSTKLWQLTEDLIRKAKN